MRGTRPTGRNRPALEDDSSACCHRSRSCTCCRATSRHGASSRVRGLAGACCGRGEAVDPDVIGCEFHRRRAREVDESALSRRVPDVPACPCHAAVDRTLMMLPPRPAMIIGSATALVNTRAPVRQTSTCRRNSSTGIELQDALVVEHHRVIHRDVDAPPLLQRRLHHLSRMNRVRDVSADGGRPPPASTMACAVACATDSMMSVHMTRAPSAAVHRPPRRRELALAPVDRGPALQTAHSMMLTLPWGRSASSTRTDLRLTNLNPATSSLSTMWRYWPAYVSRTPDRTR